MSCNGVMTNWATIYVVTNLINSVSVEEVTTNNEPPPNLVRTVVLLVIHVRLICVIIRVVCRRNRLQMAPLRVSSLAHLVSPLSNLVTRLVILPSIARQFLLPIDAPSRLVRVSVRLVRLTPFPLVSLLLFPWSRLRCIWVLPTVRNTNREIRSIRSVRLTNRVLLPFLDLPKAQVLLLVSLVRNMLRPPVMSDID